MQTLKIKMHNIKYTDYIYNICKNLTGYLKYFLKTKTEIFNIYYK